MAEQTRTRRLVSILGGTGILLGSALVGASASHGQATTSLHDIPWYVAHPAAREATLKLCQSDHRFARDVDCLNAETAGTKAWGEQSAKRAGLRGGGPFDDLVSPQYWASNSLSRIGVLASCRHPPTIYQPDVCAAARQGEAMAAGRKSRP